MVTFYRRLPKFDYLKPQSLEEVLNLLGGVHNGQFMVYAGGTDVIPKIKARMMKAPDVLVDLKGIPDMDYIRYNDESGLRIGALATIFSVAHAPVVREKYPILAMAAGSIASIQIQNRGTITGNICNAVPSADSAPALLCMGAQLLCVGKKGERWINIKEFFKGPSETILNPDELLKEIHIPPMSENSHGVYLKLSPRSKMDLAVVGVAAVVEAEKGFIKDIRLGLGAVAPTPMRAQRAEDILRGETANDEKIKKAARTASDESKPIDDHRASAEYRKMMVEVLVERAIRQALSVS